MDEVILNVAIGENSTLVMGNMKRVVTKPDMSIQPKIA